MDSIEELLERGVANIIPNKSVLLGKLRAGKKLNIYLGIDPTSTKIHLGHTVPLRKLQKFAESGHNVTFLIGDFTALIGDTSDKDAERLSLTSKEIKENFKTYKKQAEKILDFSKVKIRYNSEWLKKLTFEEIIRLNQHFSANDLLSRELIKKRISEGKRVGLHEFSYPVMQGYDSFMLDTDLQIGGTDQTFNMQAGRTLIKDLKNKESFVLTTTILEGTDGRKMSKSWGNAIWLDDNPNDMYAKVMSVFDNLIIQYFTLVTDIPLEKISDYEKKLKKENPINIKKELAFEIVKELHSLKAAKDAQKEFEKTVQNRETPEDISYIYSNSKHINILVALHLSEFATSVSDAKRLIKQKGVFVDDVLIEKTDNEIDLSHERVLRVGRRFKKIKMK